MHPGATRLTVLYTIYCWVPVVALVHLDNGWIGIPIKLLSAFWLIAIFWRFFYDPMLQSWVGVAGAGFLFNTLWFAILNFWPPLWARVVLAVLILWGFNGIRVSIINREKDLSNAPRI